MSNRTRCRPTARIRNWRNEAIIDLVDLNQLVLDQLEGEHFLQRSGIA